MIIERLDSGSKYLSTVSFWLWREWGNSSNARYWQSWVERSTCSSDIPQTFIGRIGESIVGTVSLWRCDLQSCQDIYPWLGGLYVDIPFRRNGYAKQLVSYALNAAQELGYREIFLYTELIDFFENLGWVYQDRVPNEYDVMVNLLKKELDIRG